MLSSAFTRTRGIGLPPPALPEIPFNPSLPKADRFA